MKLSTRQFICRNSQASATYERIMMTERAKIYLFLLKFLNKVSMAKVFVMFLIFTTFTPLKTFVKNETSEVAKML